MGRKKKFEDPTTYSFKMERDLKKIARNKAERENMNLSDYLRSCLRTFANVNSEIDELKTKLKEVKDKEKELQQERKYLENKLEQKKEEEKLELTDKEKAYLSNEEEKIRGIIFKPFSEHSESAQKKKIRAFAAKRSMSPQKFVRKVKEKHGFDLKTGETAMDMGGEDES